MEYRGPPIYPHNRSAMPEESHIGPVPDAIPINNGQIRVLATEVTGMPEAHILGDHANFTHNPDPGQIAEQPHQNHLPLMKEVNEEGIISSVVPNENLDSLPAEGINGEIKEDIKSEIKIEDGEEESYVDFLEAAHDIFLKVSSKELGLKSAADQLEKPYSYVYRRYQEFCDKIAGVERPEKVRRPYRPPRGSKKRRSKRRLTVAKYNTNSGETFQCDECPAKYNWKSQLVTHSKVHLIENESHPCTACGVVFPKLKILMRHRMKAHEEALQCPHCNSQFTNIPAYNYHIHTHSGKKPHECSECGKGFYQKFSLEAHKRVHTGERPYMCGYCDKTFITLTKLKMHTHIHTGTQAKAFECEECGKRYAANSALLEHMNTHTGAKPYACDECDARFNFKANLRCHKMIHSGEQPFKCEFCPAAFTLSTDLKRHTTVHTGLKPFKCDLCDYACTRKSNLEFHKYTHTGETPFKCDFYGCTAEFSRPKTLKKHKLQHGPPPPQTCKVCHENFPDLTSLKRHMMLHTGEKPYTCEQCFKICFDKSAFKRHMYKHMYKPFEQNKPKQVRQRKKNPVPDMRRVDIAAPTAPLNTLNTLNYVNTLKKWPNDGYQVPEVAPNAHSAHILHPTPAVSHYAWNTNAEDTNSQPAAQSSFHPFTASQYTNLVNNAWPSAMDPDELRRRLLNSFK